MCSGQGGADNEHEAVSSGNGQALKTVQSPYDFAARQIFKMCDFQFLKLCDSVFSF